MNHAVSLLVLLLILQSSLFHFYEESSRYENIEELVKQTFHFAEPYLKGERNGMPKDFLENYLKKEEEKKRMKTDVDLIKSKYAEQAKKMFFHAYDSYMTHAFPADELMPLSCKGRVRGLSKSRGEIDDALGRYMLTLVDTLDTLIVLKEYDRFEEGVKHVIRGLSFDTDITVSVFEVNIRVLGGLLGGHTGCLYLQSIGRAGWYVNELLLLAQELANRLLPAFDTPTGLPVPKINLRHGTLNNKDNETCTACAGTLYMEFAALSRFTGNGTYENKARAALDYLYKHRAPASDLPGSVININSGQWIRKDTSVGAGIDSYYEYLIKGYIISGDKKLWDMFSTHYGATRQYLKKREYMVTVHSGAPINKVREHQDALQAFWPGIQVLAGDIEEAVEVYNHYIKVSKRNRNTLPEAFLVDYRMHWPQYYIRPELLESTYSLYKATGDPRYVDEAARIMQAIESRCRVECGYASLKNTASGELEDRLDSFVLAETFKYLYLIFADDEDIGIPMDDYVLTTEAHLVPLHIQLFSNEMVASSNEVCENQGVYHWSWLEEMVFGKYQTKLPDMTMMCFPEDQPSQFKSRTLTSALKAADFDYKNLDHTSTLLTMGIDVEYVDGNNIRLIHSYARAQSQKLAVEGVIFMKEIQDFASSITSNANDQQSAIKEVFAQSTILGENASFEAGKAMFGPDLVNGGSISGLSTVTFPADGCTVIINQIKGKIALIERGGCMFVEKVRIAEKGGAVAVVILDNKESGDSGVVAMSGDGTNDVNIPSLLVNKGDSMKLLDLYRRDTLTLVVELREPYQVPAESRCGS